jgi:phosphatidylserine decarboxylase
MRIPLTRYGLPQVAIYPPAILAAMVAYGLVALRYSPGWTPWALRTFWGLEIVLLALLVWSLSFFRDPRREVPQDDRLLLAPADGVIRDVETVDEKDFIGGPALRIGIFLSVFNVHINRTPCAARIEKITYRRGRFLNAMNLLAGKVNESNDVAMVKLPSPVSGEASDASLELSGRGLEPDPTDSTPPATNAERRATKLLVRQVSGAIARRIVCAAREGQQLAAGERFGMIKFGSRTELYVPAGDKIECLVRPGDRVKAGITPVARYT